MVYISKKGSVLLGAVVQMELYPRVTVAEKDTTREKLEEYPEMVRKIRVYGNKNSLTVLEAKELEDCRWKVREIDAAFELILDDEVAAIIKHRYVNARKHKLTILRYTANSSKATINRRIDVGVETIAEHLKLAGII